MAMTSTRINLWSSPRNVSTAFMYSFAQRSDTTVVDEPLYAHYLAGNATAVQHPGREEILRSQDMNGERVVSNVILGHFDTPIVLFKQMTHHLINLDLSFLSLTQNILLIRDPRAIIASYAKVIPNPDMQDIGVEQQYELFELLRKKETLAAVIDARELLLNPRRVLEQLCDRLSIPFQEEMLRWQAGPRPEDGVWAEYWYDNVHRSTGFNKYEETTVSLPAHLEELNNRCRPYYEELLRHSLRHDG
jgi:hypothetical protein